MSVLEWPADLTDLRLPPAWDGRPVDWHGWHHPSKPAPCSSARTTAYNAIRNHVPAAGTRSNPGETKD